MIEVRDFLEYIRVAVGVDSQREVFLRYKDFVFMLEPHGAEIQVFSRGESLGIYKNFEEMINFLMIDGKPFIERIAEIEYDD